MALSLTAANESDYLDITSGLEAFPCNELWTICGWIYLRSEPTGDGFYFYSHSADDSYANGDIFNIDRNSFVRLTTADEDHHSGGLEDHTGSTALDTDQWYFFAAVYDGAGIEVSIDLNVEFTTTLPLEDRDGITKMVLGNYVGGGAFFADVRTWGWKAWTAALDETAIELEMTQGRPVRTADLWASWDFATTGADRSDDDFSTHDWTEHGSPGNDDGPSVPLGAGTTVTPGTASLTTTKFTPSVNTTDHKTVTPGTVDLTVTRFAPSSNVSDHKVVVPGTVNLTTTLFTPTVENGIRVIPGTGGLTTTLLIPTVEYTAHVVAVPGKVDLVLTRFTPTVIANQHIAEPGTATLTLTSFAPSVETTTPLPLVFYGEWTPNVVFNPGDQWRVLLSGPSADHPRVVVDMEFRRVLL